MTKIRFSGFPEGASVSLSAAKDGSTKGPLSVSAWRREPVARPGNSGEMTIRVFNWAQDQPAPVAVWFEAHVTGNTGLPTRVNGDIAANAIYDDYDQQFHELEFEWSFGDTGTWSYADRLPTHLQSRDYGYGKMVNHVYATPGDKIVTCWAYRMDVDGSGNLTRTLVATKTITFADGGDHPRIPSLDEMIPLNRRVYFNPDGDYSDAPAGATTGADLNANTMYAVFQWAQNRGVPAAVFFRRGTTSSWTASNIPPNENPRLYVGAYGVGERPIVEAPNGGGPFNTRATNWTGIDRGGYFVVDGLDVVGAWDAVTETGIGSQGLFGGEGVTHHLAHDCIFRDCGGPIVSFQLLNGQGLEIGERSMTLCNTLITGWRDYGVMVRGNARRSFRHDASILGCAIRQPPNAAQGINGKDGDQNAHGPIRVANVHNLLIRANDLYSRTHWDAKAQACIRADMNSAQQWGEIPGRTIIYGNSCEGGGTQILSAGAGGTEAPGGAILCPTGYSAGQNGCRAHIWPKNTLIKHNLMLGSFSVEQAIAVTRSCMSVIENVAIRPDVKTWTSNGDTRRGRDWSIGAKFVSYDLSERDHILNENGWVPGLNDELVRNPVRVIGNVTIDLKTTTDPGDERTVEDIADISELYQGLVEVRDNTLWAPNYGTAPVTTTGPFVYVQNVPPRETYGVRHDGVVNAAALTASMTDNIGNNDVFDIDVSYATPNDGLTLYRPSPVAGIAGTATGPMSHRDFLGAVRAEGQRPSQGAIEPA